MKFGGDFDYETGGAGYAQIRRTDPRIAAHVHEALGAARTVLNVGAGAGSYEPADRHLIAIEPSDQMRSQRPAGAVPAIHGFAEDLPLDDHSVDAAMAMITVHQWSDQARGLAQLRRVARGPVVVLAFDGPALGDYWFNDYAPELIAAEQKRFPPVDWIAEQLGGRTQITPIPIPLDCTDGFIEAFYGRPERLLDPAVRAAQSSWGFVEPHVAPRLAEQLGADLASGAWDERHGALRQAPWFDGSLRLIVSWP